MYRNNFAAGWMNLGTVKAALHKEDVSLIALFMFPQIIDYDLTFQQALFFCVTTGERPGAQVVVSQASRERIKGILKSNLCLVLCHFFLFLSFDSLCTIISSAQLRSLWSYKICFLGSRKMLQQRYKIQTKISRRFFQPWKSGKKKRSIVFKPSKCIVQAVQIQWYNPFTWTLDSFPFITFTCVFILTLKSSPPVHRSRQNCKSHCRI